MTFFPFMKWRDYRKVNIGIFVVMGFCLGLSVYMGFAVYFFYKICGDSVSLIFWFFLLIFFHGVQM